MLRRAVVLFVVALVAVRCGGRGPSHDAHASDAIKIGLVVPLTGDVKTFGESARNGAMLAFDEVNAAGGIRGRRIKVIASDDKNDPTEAHNAGSKLIDVDRVVGVVGSVSTKCSLPLADVCQTAGIPMITPTSTNPKVTVDETGRHKSFIFRACFTDDFQGAVAARFAIDSLRVRTAAVMYDVGNDYAKELAKFFRQRFEELGGKVVAYESYQKDDADFSALVGKVRQSRPDVVFLPDYYNKVGLIAKEIRKQGLGAVLLGGDGWDSPAMLDIAGSAIEGGFFVNHYSPDEQRPEVQAWVQKYMAKYGQRPDALATLGYDAALLMLEGIRAAASTKPEDIRSALTLIRDYPCVSGATTFDANGNPVKKAAIIQYTSQGQRYVAAAAP